MREAWLNSVPINWTKMRSDAVLEYKKRPARNADFATIQIFHYSIPVVQETGDGAVELGSEIDSDKIYLKGDELLVSKLNPRKGCVVLAKPNSIPIVASTEFIPLAPKQGIDRVFAYYLYASEPVRSLISSTVKSATRSHQRAEPEDITKIWIPVPPLHTQIAIATFLDRETARLDALVAAKLRVLDLLAEKRKAIISTAVTRGLDPKAKLRDSGIPWLGEIPVHWSVARLKFLAAEPMAYGASEPSDFAIPSHPRFIRITDIGEDGSLREDTFRSLEPEVATPYLLRCGDMLFARSGATVGKTFLFAGKDGSACFAGYLIRFRSNLERILPSFLSALAQSTYYWWCIREGSLQATIQNFSAEKYGDIVVAVPPLNDQHAIVDHIAHESAKLEAMRAATERTITLLKERRSALIAAAVTGQLDLEAAK